MLRRAGSGSVWIDPPDRLVTLELAVLVLAALVRQEYPDDLSLAEIARRWGHDRSPDHLAALAQIESDLATKAPLGVGEKAIDVGEIQP
jgi:hypothetical protein